MTAAQEGPALGSVQEVRVGLEAAGYLADEAISTVVFLVGRLTRPLLVEGPAGVGKTVEVRTLRQLEHFVAREL